MQHQRIVISKFGGPEVLQHVEMGSLDSQAGEVVIRVRDVGVFA